MVRHLISLEDLDDQQLNDIVRRGVDFAAGRAGDGRPLSGRVAGILFRKTSTRTRTAFSSGALRLGAGIVAFGPDDLQTNTGETLEDTGEVLSRMLDLVVARTAADPAELRSWATQHRMAVINAMSADEHPTQGLTDLTTILERFGRIDGLRLLYLGEGNNTAAALALGLSRFDVELELRTPPGYGLPAETWQQALARAAISGARLRERHDVEELPEGVDVIYTTRWQTTGTVKPDPDWRERFAPFQVGTGLWRSNPKALFMHDLPAHRGEEVQAEVLDGPASIAFQQAGNKLSSALAVLEWCAGAPDQRP